MSVNDEVKKLHEDCTRRFDEIDEMLKMLLVTNASLLIDDKSRMPVAGKSQKNIQRTENKAFGFVNKRCGNIESLDDILLETRYKIIMTAELCGIGYIIIDTGTQATIAAVRKIEKYIKSNIKGFDAIYVIDKLNTTTYKLLLKEGYSFIIRNQATHINSRR